MALAVKKTVDSLSRASGTSAFLLIREGITFLWARHVGNYVMAEVCCSSNLRGGEEKKKGHLTGEFEPTTLYFILVKSSTIWK